jgi:hypothetical protein
LRTIPKGILQAVFLAAAFWSAADVFAQGGAGARRKVKAAPPPDTMELPFEKGRVYSVPLLPGSPFVLELPQGESAAQLWFDEKWWTAETVPDGSRVVLTASRSENAVGEVGFIHIETTPGNLRISLRVSVVDRGEAVPAALELYQAKRPGRELTPEETRRRADRDLLYAQKMAADKARADVAEFRRQALTNLRTNFEWGGDFRVGRVVDDRVQTFIVLAEPSSERAVMQFVDRTGKNEVVNFDFENGTYVVQRVLHPGEKFRLILGKQMSWIALK